MFHVKPQAPCGRGCLTRPSAARQAVRAARPGPLCPTERPARDEPSRGRHTRRRAVADRARRPPAPPRHRRRQPEGRRRQDDDDDQRRRLPGRARPAHADHRPRSAGQRLDRPGHREPRPGDVDVPRADARGAAGELHRADRRAGPLRRPGEPRPGRGRDRAGPGVQPGDPAAAGHRGRRRRLRLRAHRLPAVARPAHGQRAQRRPTRCSCRSSASTTPSRASASCCATSTSCGATSTRRWRSARSCA